MKPIAYDWNCDPDDLRLITVDEILTAYENGKIGAGTAIARLDLRDEAELQETMEYNGRTMPWARPMRLSAATIEVLEEALGVGNEHEAVERAGVL